MKEITDQLRDKFEKEMESISSVGGLETKIGNHTVIIPTKVLSMIEKRTRMFEVNSVEDIFDNYSLLSSYKYLPLSVLSWFIKNTPLSASKETSMQKPETFEQARKEFKKQTEEMKKMFTEFFNYQDLIWPDRFRWNLRFNLNIGLIDDVYLSSFSFIKARLYDACEFDVSDKSGRVIKGLLVKSFNENNDDVYNKHLTNILSESDTTAFDLQFLALTDKYKIKKDGIYVKRDKRLFVLDVHKSNGNDKYYKPYDNLDILSPVLQLV